MSAFHRPDHMGVHLLLGALAVSVSIGLTMNLPSSLISNSTPQNITTAERLMKASSMTPAQMDQARRDRCTPGFSCRTSAPIYSKVTVKRAMQFAYVIGQGVNR